MSGYYRDRLHGDQLKRCYDLAPPRIRQYLSAEVEHVVAQIPQGCSALELGCGYGRVLPRIASRAGITVGIDISLASIVDAARSVKGGRNCHVLVMDATKTGFRDRSFDRVVCIQNGISAFHVAPGILIGESLRIARAGGIVFFSTYSPAIWHERLEWFKRQSRAGLIGEIDRDRTRDGTIVCRDGFTATTITPDEFRILAQGIPAALHIEEVDGSSVFFALAVGGK